MHDRVPILALPNNASSSKDFNLEILKSRRPSSGIKTRLSAAAIARRESRNKPKYAIMRELRE